MGASLNTYGTSFLTVLRKGPDPLNMTTVHKMAYIAHVTLYGASRSNTQSPSALCVLLESIFSLFFSLRNWIRSWSRLVWPCQNSILVGRTRYPPLQMKMIKYAFHYCTCKSVKLKKTCMWYGIVGMGGLNIYNEVNISNTVYKETQMKPYRWTRNRTQDPCITSQVLYH